MKNKTVAGLLALFLGGFGIHKFYLGKLNGILYLIFCWTFIPSIIALIEAIRYFTMSDKDFNSIYNSNEKKKTNLEELEKLHSLKEKGAISEEEYKDKKAEILNNKKQGIKEDKGLKGGENFFNKLKDWVIKHKILSIFLFIFIIFFVSSFIFGTRVINSSNDLNDKERNIVVDPVKLEADQKRLEELKARFNYKYDEFKKVGWYENKNQTADNSFNRTLLKVIVRNDGYNYLEDQYYASDWLFHTKIQVIIEGVDKVYESDEVPIYSKNNTTENSGGSIWETISYLDGGDNGIVQAIAENSDKQIKVRFSGREYVKDVVLSKIDKQAVKDSYELANLLKEVK